MTDYHEILIQPALAGVYETPEGSMQDILDAAAANNFLVYRIDMRSARARDQMLGLISSVMDLPSWFGHNFDGLMDCLCDMSWAPASGYVLLMENCHNIHHIAAADFNMLLDVLAEVTATWREEGKAFWSFVDLPSNV